MRYAQLASRVFGVPLLVERHKLEVILSALGPRLGVEADQPSLFAAVEMGGPGDEKGRKSYILEVPILDIDLVDEGVQL